MLFNQVVAAKWHCHKMQTNSHQEFCGIQPRRAHPEQRGCCDFGNLGVNLAAVEEAEGCTGNPRASRAGNDPQDHQSHPQPKLWVRPNPWEWGSPGKQVSSCTPEELQKAQNPL